VLSLVRTYTVLPATRVSGLSGIGRCIRVATKPAAVEHRRILADVERKDFAAAGAEMRNHILNTGEEIRRHFPAGGKKLTD